MFILRTLNVNNVKAMWQIEVDRESLLRYFLDDLDINDSSKLLITRMIKYLCNINHSRNETNNIIDGKWWQRTIINLDYKGNSEEYYNDLKVLVNAKLIELPYITSNDIKICDKYYYLIYK